MHKIYSQNVRVYDFVSKHCWRIFVDLPQEEDKESKGNDEETKKTIGDSVVYACYIKCSYANDLCHIDK